MIDIAHPQRASVVARKRHFISLRKPYRRFVRKRERRVRRDGADRRARTEDLEEVGVEDLEEGRGGVRRVEVHVERVRAERAVVSEHVEREGVD